MRTARIILILPVVAFVAWYAFSLDGDYIRQNRYTGALTLLKQEGYIDRSSDDFVRRVITHINSQTNFFEEINVNDNFKKEALNIFVLEVTDKWKQMDQPVIKQLYRVLKNNIIAIPPNLLLIDSNFINLLILSLYNDSLGLAEAILSPEWKKPNEHEKESVTKATKMGLIDTHLRLNNIQSIREDPNYFKELAHEISNATSSFDVVHAYTLGILPIIAHEYYHLNKNQERKYLPDLDEITSKTLSRFRSSAEDQADSFAISIVEKYLSDKKKEMNKNRLLIEINPFITLSKLLQDTVLVEAFGDFRGLQASALLLELLHKPCEEQSAFQRTMQFNHPDKVASGFRVRFPLLTKDEYERLRASMNSPSFSNHSHHLERAYRMLKIVEPFHVVEISNVVLENLLTLNIIREGNPSKLVNVDVLKPIGLTRKRLLNNLYEGLSIVPSVSCQPGLCSVGFFEKGSGFLELIGLEEELREVDLFLPLFSDKVEEQIHNRIVLLGFLFNLTQDWTLSSKLHIKIVKDLAKCGTVSFIVDFDQFLLLVATINPQRWVKCTIIAKSKPLNFPSTKTLPGNGR